MVMILGYGIIAVPTGIVSAEYTAQNKPKQEPEKPKIDLNTQACSNCSVENHKDNAEFCYNCGHKLNHE
jgi:voltage-gated potassium channel